jgi:hypothetical protein
LISALGPSLIARSKISNRKTLKKHQIRQPLLLENVRNPGDQLGVADREPAIADHGFDRFREVQQAQKVGNRRSILPQPPRQLRLGQPS